jgi:hypothetical protein
LLQAADSKTEQHNKNFSRTTYGRAVLEKPYFLPLEKPRGEVKSIKD